MAKETPQYRAVIENYSKLLSSLEATPGAKDQLRAKFVAKVWMGPGAAVDAAKMINAALNNIELNPENYKEFIEMLKGIPGLQIVVEKIIRRCGSSKDQGDIIDDGPDPSGSAAALTVNKTDHEPKYKMECFTDWMKLINDGDGDELWTTDDSPLWPKGKELKVMFMNIKDLNWKKEDDESIQTHNILDIANEWHQCGKDVVPKFIQCKHNENSDIRVQFIETGNPSSIVGIWARNVARNEPTMWLNLAPFDNNPLRYRRTILHEFGHALGLKHEHQHPDAPELINEHELYKCMADKYKTMTTKKIKDKIQSQWLKFGEASQKGSYDKDSIMHYLIPVKVRATGYKGPTDLPMTLSAKDECLIVKFYSGEEVQEEHIEMKTDHTRMDEGTIRDEGIGESDNGQSSLPATQTKTLKQSGDIFDVKQALQPVSASWADVGLALLRDQNKITTIRKQFHNDPSECTTEMLSQWLKKNYDHDTYGDPTWHMLANAVQSVDKDTADAIRKR